MGLQAGEGVATPQVAVDRTGARRYFEKVKLYLTKYKSGELLKEGGACHELVFILKGEIAFSYIIRFFLLLHRIFSSLS